MSIIIVIIIVIDIGLIVGQPSHRRRSVWLLY